jgi:hypothetical protein
MLAAAVTVMQSAMPVMSRRLCGIKSSGLTLTHHYARRAGALEVFAVLIPQLCLTSRQPEENGQLLLLLAKLRRHNRFL